MLYPSLSITIQGRIIDHLGIQMYQSPTAAIAELIANSWDADAENVYVKVPDVLGDGSGIEIIDDGNGMNADECQHRFLSVGACRRLGGKTLSEKKRRPVLGKKGIGKFAGFGIATEIVVDTTSQASGERTKFVMDLNKLRDEKEEIDKKPIAVLAYEEPSPGRVESHGTYLTLHNLSLTRRIPLERFRLSMARRFSLQSRSSDFKVYINDELLTDGFDVSAAEYDFPAAYSDGERPPELVIEGGWGVEKLPGGQSIKWRFIFIRVPIDDDELRGISGKGKMAQRPFSFNLTGGLGGQHGLEYLTGRVEADYIDDLPFDLISPERQRIDWENAATQPLEEWGQLRVKALLRIWKERRAEERTRIVESRISSFGSRLEKLPPHERKTVHSALKKIAEIETLDGDRLDTLCGAILTSWEEAG